MNNIDANESYELFQSTLLSIFNDHFPLQTKNVYNKADRKPCFFPGTLTSIRAKRRFEKKARSNPDRYLTIYRRHKNLLTKVTRATRDQYYRTLLETSTGNSKKIWSNINCVLGKKHSSINATIKLDGIHVAEPETIANTFNSYFNSIHITLSDNINNNLTAFESYLDDQILESDNFHQTSIHEITKIIKNIKNINSVGWDNIPTTNLKQMS